MKKIALLLTIVMILSTITVSAVSVGDKISEAVYSDLDVYINHYPIPAYVVNDYAVIVAEDLADYCCDVIWNENERTLNITPSAEKNEFANLPVYKTSMPTGTVYADVLHTDIKTFVNGNEITSFNVNGRTMIVIDEFGRNIGEYVWADDIRAAKAWIDDKPVKNYAPISYRTQVLFMNNMMDYNQYVWTEQFFGSHDFDFDGISENISIEIISPTDDTWVDQTARITIGNKSTVIDTTGAGIDAVYACDIDKTDGHKDLAVIMTEYSGDPNLRIFKYIDGLGRYEFQVQDWEGKIYQYDSYGTGYIDNCYFNVNDDDSISLECQTSSPGMWDVIRTFYRDDYNVFVELKPSFYTVLDNFMVSRSEFFREVSSYEKSMWNKGYMRAYNTYSSNGFTIYKDEYFKVIYDDGNSCLFVEKQNGQSGWIYIDYSAYNDLNPQYFAVAG